MGLGLLFRADHGGVREDGLWDGLLGEDVDKGYDLWLVGYLVLDVAFELGSGFGEGDGRPICVASIIG
jgi:hypothetical protein